MCKTISDVVGTHSVTPQAPTHKMPSPGPSCLLKECNPGIHIVSPIKEANTFARKICHNVKFHTSNDNVTTTEIVIAKLVSYISVLQSSREFRVSRFTGFARSGFDVLRGQCANVGGDGKHTNGVNRAPLPIHSESPETPDCFGQVQLHVYFLQPPTWSLSSRSPLSLAFYAHSFLSGSVSLSLFYTFVFRCFSLVYHSKTQHTHNPENIT